MLVRLENGENIFGLVYFQWWGYLPCLVVNSTFTASECGDMRSLFSIWNNYALVLRLLSSLYWVGQTFRTFPLVKIRLQVSCVRMYYRNFCWQIDGEEGKIIYSTRWRAPSLSVASDRLPKPAPPTLLDLWWNSPLVVFSFIRLNITWFFL